MKPLVLLFLIGRMAHRISYFRTLALTALAVSSLVVVSAACSGERATDLEFRDAPVVVISIDTLRADHLPAYGYRGVETPNIDALRSDGVLFTNAWAHVPLTLPSHVSIFTGTLPTKNGVRNNIGYHFGPGQRTLAEDFKARGYRTGGAVSAYVLRSSTGIARGFDFYDDGIINRAGVAIGSLMRPGSETAAVALKWLDSTKDAPFFLFAHFFEPHSPYAPPPPFAARYANAYDGEIAAADAAVGEVIEHLKKQNLYDDSIIVLLSDHGEGLGDHGEPEHGIFVYREAIHVPLFVKLPGSAKKGETIKRTVGLVDIFPTLLSLTGADIPKGLDGRSLFAAEPEGTTRRIYAESLYGRIHLGWAELYSLVDDRFHFIDAPRPELYSVSNDPQEKTNLLSQERRTYASMRKELAPLKVEVKLPTAVDAEERAKLEALGYLGSSAPETSGALPDPKDRIVELNAMMAASKLVDLGQVDEGIAALREILRQNPKFSDAWTKLAMTLERQGRFEEAAAAYREAIRISPSLSAEYALSLGSILLRMGKFDDAEAHARLAERAVPAGAHLLLARVAFAKGDSAAAEREARAAAEDESFAPTAKMILAELFIARGRLNEALALATEVAADAQRRSLGPIESLQFVRGDALARMDRTEEAIAAFRSEISNFPANRRAYANLALLYLVSNQAAAADSLFEEYVSKNPDPQSYEFVVTTLTQLDQPAAAAKWRERSRQAAGKKVAKK